MDKTQLSEYRRPFPCKTCSGRGFIFDTNPHSGNVESSETCSACKGLGVSPEGERQAKWDGRFLQLAITVSFWSKDPSTKHGAVLVRPDFSVASLGFNGFPRGMADGINILENRDEKYRRVIHAEMNALLNSRESFPLGPGWTMYTTGPCCARCMVHLLQAGLRRFVSMPATSEQRARWESGHGLQYAGELRAEVIERSVDVS